MLSVFLDVSIMEGSGTAQHETKILFRNVEVKPESKLRIRNRRGGREVHLINTGDCYCYDCYGCYGLLCLVFLCFTVFYSLDASWFSMLQPEHLLLSILVESCCCLCSLGYRCVFMWSLETKPSNSVENVPVCSQLTHLFQLNNLHQRNLDHLLPPQLLPWTSQISTKSYFDPSSHSPKLSRLISLSSPADQTSWVVKTCSVSLAPNPSCFPLRKCQ